MNAIFTIVAKNYFALALTLAESIKKNQPNIDFYILLVDEADDLTVFEGKNHTLVLAKDINIPNYYDLAFKYNVTEFCTSVKPFFFDYLFKRKNYEKIIYFDPDIYVYSSLNKIFDSLNRVDAVITPHFITPEINYTGEGTETLTLFAGIYNLGFIAIKNSVDGLKIIDWWKDRLHNLCYADKFEALHVDQKWMDFLPALFADIEITRYMGYNIAYWNIHERQFKNNGNNYTVENRIDPKDEHQLIFAHFSGVDPLDIYNNKQCPTININSYPDWEPVLQNYSKEVMNQDYKKYLIEEYTYSKFDNGSKISPFQRRLFRRIVDEKVKIFSNPFSTSEDSFFQMLKDNGLLIKSGSVNKLNERNLEGFEGKIKKLNTIMRYLKKFLGFEKYVLLLKFCQRYFRPENQTFLIDGMEDYIRFKNENIK